jgi:hypothetical protein
MTHVSRASIITPTLCVCPQVLEEISDLSTASQRFEDYKNIVRLQPGGKDVLRNAALAGQTSIPKVLLVINDVNLAAVKQQMRSAGASAQWKAHGYSNESAQGYSNEEFAAELASVSEPAEDFCRRRMQGGGTGTM